MLIRKKYQLPLVQKIPDIQFDIGLLRAEVERLSEHWTNIFQANAGLCAAHPELAENNYKHFDQINLTTFDGEEAPLDLEEAREACQKLSSATRNRFGSLGAYRAKTRQRNLVSPALNEHNWHIPLPIYKNSKIEEQITKNFRAKPIRVRLVRLASGKSLSPHIDYCPTYAVRVIVPIATHPDVKNVFWKHEERSEVHLPADGGAYFLNVGFRHSVENHSSIDRLSLMFSLDSQLDIQNL